MSEKKCLKCNRPFKGGEKYLEVASSSKVDYYHENCWKEVEAESNSNQPICKECKKSIKVGEEYAEETMPDSFQPHTVRYHKSCWEQKQRNDDNINTRRACSTCGHIGLPGACQYCMAMGNRRGVNNNNNYKRERERERAKSESEVRV